MTLLDAVRGRLSRHSTCVAQSPMGDMAAETHHQEIQIRVNKAATHQRRAQAIDSLPCASKPPSVRLDLVQAVSSAGPPFA